ncbi:recombinase family protein [Roseomonas sp. KE2513]|uniref:recombinase family protein n=1 Tax=Roseomonas sp. KE2513 TaxID=2479202 RepID=UPI0035CC1388
MLGGDRGWRPPSPPCSTAATEARQEEATRAAYRLILEFEALRAAGVTTRHAVAQALTEKGVPTPRGGHSWTHTTVTRVLQRVVT